MMPECCGNLRKVMCVIIDRRIAAEQRRSEENLEMRKADVWTVRAGLRTRQLQDDRNFLRLKLTFELTSPKCCALRFRETEFEARDQTTGEKAHRKPN